MILVVQSGAMPIIRSNGWPRTQMIDTSSRVLSRVCSELRCQRIGARDDVAVVNIIQTPNQYTNFWTGPTVSILNLNIDHDQYPSSSLFLTFSGRFLAVGVEQTRNTSFSLSLDC